MRELWEVLRVIAFYVAIACALRTLSALTGL